MFQIGEGVSIVVIPAEYMSINSLQTDFGNQRKFPYLVIGGGYKIP